MVHVASLIVDDLQDGHQRRWGRPSVWMSDGHALAMNTAISMLTLAQKLSDRLRIGIVASLSETLGNMLDGQALDLQAFQLYQEGLYLKIAGGKTGALLQFAATVGGHSQADDLRQHLSNWAFNLGVAHQIQDDLDDIIDHAPENLYPSNIHWFLAAEVTSHTADETRKIACRLASDYVAKGIAELSFSSVPECLREDLLFISKALGERRSTAPAHS